MPKPRYTDIEGLDMKWHVVRLLLPYLLQFKGRVVMALLALAAAKLATISLPFVLKYVVDELDSERLQDSQLVLPLGLIIGYGVLRFANVLFNELRDALFGRVTESSIRRISLLTFSHVHSLDLDFHLNRRTGGLSRDIERGTSGISFLMRFMIFNILPTLFELVIVISIFLSVYGIEFSAVIVVSIVLYILFTVLATERRTQYVRAMAAADSATMNRAVDSLLNYETVKYFTNESYESKLYDKDLAQWEVAKRDSRISLFRLNAGQALIIAMAMTAMLGLAAMGVSQGDMTLGDFVLVNTFMLQLFIPLNFLGFVYREIKGALANIENMFKLLEVKPSVIESIDAKPLQSVLPSITFDHVNFAYNERREILKNVSFSIAPGEKVAVVGPSGSGKSTLVKLLFRFYDCAAGSVKINGDNVRDLQLCSLRSAIGIVPQDTVLFNDSLYNNILYGRPHATRQEVQQAVNLAQLDNFIAQLPDGLDTVVGERGLKLSGGEKQRVAIARTILKQPSILVFDEATSALDSRTESGILEALAAVALGHTSLVIAHRLSTIIDADKIVVMDQGRVVESGTHQQLLADEGVYAAMWKAQLQAKEKEAVQKEEVDRTLENIVSAN
jgi:ABC-type transport system involved in Fe-S cluster assembly fused permease/ATPase subunit